MDQSGRAREIARNDIQFVNWRVDSLGYVSEQDPQMLLYNVSGYVDRLELQIDTEVELSPKIYFTTSLNQDFSEENGFVPEYTYSDGVLQLTVQRDVQRLRIDLIEQAGMRMRFAGARYFASSFALEPVNLLCFLVLLGMLLLPVYFPMQTFRNIGIYLRGLKRYGYLLETLVRRDLVVKYRRSLLGVVWSVLQPLLMMIVITVVFQRLFRFRVANFPVYYLTGVLLFNFNSEATTGAMTSVVSSAPLIRKVYIPKYIFPLEKCLFAFVNMLLSLVAVFIMLVVLGVQPTWSMLLFFVPLLYVFVFSIGIGLILASHNVFLRDITHLYSVFVTAWMYLTPIIYPIEILPPAVLAVVRLNPMYHYVAYFRSVMLYGTVPGWSENAVCIVFSLLFLGMGLLFFKKRQDQFVLYL